ncbi:tetratricopeptide repeat protein [Candidatus Desantisbacteria bacterium]|nr:tetratricopeptide repeat protein [Candidatus Desantisbacteria bacterium]
MNLKIINKRQNYFLYDYGLNILKSIPAGGTLFIQSNHQTFATGYLTMVENRYRDIRIFDFEENFFPKIFSSIRDSTGLKTKKEIEQYLINKNPSKLFFGYKPTDASIPYGFLYSLSSMENDPWNFFTLHYGLNNISTRQWENRDIVIPEFIKTLFFGKRDDTWTCDLLTRDLISMIIFAKGEKLLYEKNITKAIDELDKISHFSYDIPSQQYSIGEKFWKLNKLEKATGAYNNVLTYIQDDFEVHNNLGIIYNLKMQNEKALVHFQKAIDISPGNAAEPYYNIGIIYQDKKNFNKALEYYKQSLKLDSARPEIYYNLGIIYSEWNKFSIAEKNYLLAITKKPAYTLARNNLGLLYFNKNEIKKAIMQFETALNYDTINLMTYYNLARVYEKLDTKTAIIKWEIYLKKAESNFDEKIWINNAKKRILELGKKM